MVRIPFFQEGVCGPKIVSSSTSAPGADAVMVLSRSAFIMVNWVAHAVELGVRFTIKVVILLCHAAFALAVLVTVGVSVEELQFNAAVDAVGLHEFLTMLHHNAKCRLVR